ncbi:MAG: bifunctional phosphoserine phosphatase/homoserine phosphotransferase ThrH [Promethearchaeota archaeon]
MYVVCFDLEGVFTPEVWINVSKATGIEELKITTRDEPDYNKLMKRRLQILREHKITLNYIQEVIDKMELLPGAKEFMDWIRSVAQVIVVTDSYVEFAMPFMKKLGYPLILCHNLETDENGLISNYCLRIRDMKKQTVKAFHQMNYEVIAAGDSYNDTAMLLEAEKGILFRPPQNVIKQFPQFPVIDDYAEFKKLLSKYLDLE